MEVISVGGERIALSSPYATEAFPLLLRRLTAAELEALDDVARTLYFAVRIHSGRHTTAPGGRMYNTERHVTTFPVLRCIGFCVDDATKVQQDRWASEMLAFGEVRDRGGDNMLSPSGVLDAMLPAGEAYLSVDHDVITELVNALDAYYRHVPVVAAGTTYTL